MATKETEQEILKDIPLILKHISQCNSSIKDLRKHIDGEISYKEELKGLITTEEKLKAEGKRNRYDVPSLIENLDRCDKNIKVFEETIDKEEGTITKFSSILETLQKDLERPSELIIDMRQSPKFRDM